MYSIKDFSFGKSSDFSRNTIYSSKLELSLSARNLVNRDISSKSDPQCFVYMRQGFTDRYIEIGRTEVINNDLNPDWAKKLNIDYKFNESQQIKFEIWNIDRMAGNKFLGQVIVELVTILVSKGTYRQNLNSEELSANSFGGEIFIRAEELLSNKQIVLMQFSASRLLEKHTYGTTDSYLVISKANSDGTFNVVHKTEVAKNAVKPKWKPFRISLQQLCSGDYERTLKFECFDFDKSGGHDSIGFFTTNLRKLITRPSHLNKYECINISAIGKESRRKGYRNSRKIKVKFINIRQEVTLLDYIRCGTEMHFGVAIDFSSSNFDICDPNSLHFLDKSGRPNSYEIAIRAIGQVIKCYDSQGLIPAFGFGANNPLYELNGDPFPLNNNISYPYCKGIEELINCYKSFLYTDLVQKPTKFAPVINKINSIARQFQDAKHYFTFLIITDKIIPDMSDTLESITESLFLPISIIIIGVGNADFDSMNDLNSDKNETFSIGKKDIRNTVRFVPMNKYSFDNWLQIQHELGRNVLAEIPQQFMQFMQTRGFMPSAPVPKQISEPTASRSLCSHDSVYPSTDLSISLASFGFSTNSYICTGSAFKPFPNITNPAVNHGLPPPHPIYNIHNPMTTIPSNNPLYSKENTFTHTKSSIPKPYQSRHLRKSYRSVSSTEPPLHPSLVNHSENQAYYPFFRK